MKKICILFVLASGLHSCKKEGYADYWISVWNDDSFVRIYRFYIDGNFEATVNSDGNTYPAINNCEDKVANVQNGNIYISVYSGQHSWELKEIVFGSEELVASGSVKIKAGECNKLTIK